MAEARAALATYFRFDNEERFHETLGYIRLYALTDGIRQFPYSQTQGLTKLLELQGTLPVQPSFFDP